MPKKQTRGLRPFQSFITNDCGVRYEISGMVMRSLVRYITSELQKGNSVFFNGLGKFGLSHRNWYSTIGKTRKWVEGKWVEGPSKVRVHPAADYPIFKASPHLRKQIHKVRKPDYGKPNEETK